MDKAEGQISGLTEEKKKTEEILLQEKQERGKDNDDNQQEIDTLKNELEKSKHEMAQVRLLWLYSGTRRNC